MIRVITITDQCGSSGAELARLVAQKLGWELLDRGMVERVARVADLDASTVGRLDAQAARWRGILTARGVNLAKICPLVTASWFEPLEEPSIRALTTQLVRAAADRGECVIVGCGAQYLLQSHADAFHVLTYAPIEERIRKVQGRDPECPDVHAYLSRTDAQTTRYALDHYGDDWLRTSLYRLCVDTSIGLHVAATLINAAVVFADKTCITPAHQEVSPCQLTHQL